MSTTVDRVTARPILGIIAIIVMGLLAFAAIRPGGVLATHVNGEPVAGNQKCHELVADWTEVLTIDGAPENKVYTEGAFSVEIYNATSTTFSFRNADPGLIAVFVKGGLAFQDPNQSGGNLYTYAVLTSADEGLTTVFGQGISHVSFCFGETEEVEETATPTPTPTPTPTEEVQETATPTPTPEETVAAGTGTPEQTVAAATGTPVAGVTPDTAAGSVSGSLAAGIFAAILLLSLLAMGRLNAVAARRRR